MPLKLHVIIGSTRPGRAGPAVAKWADEAARAHGQFDVELVDLADFNLPLLDEPNHPAKRQYTKDTTKRWSEKIAAADAFLFVTPEYDYFPPASLVNAVQVLSQEWMRKAAGIVSYGGISGGLRATQVFRSLLSNLNIHALPQTVPVPLFSQLIGEDKIFRPNDAMKDGLKVTLDELHKWAAALRPLRTSA